MVRGHQRAAHHHAVGQAAQRGGLLGREMPNPTATGTGESARSSRRRAASSGGSSVRAPVTPVTLT